MASFGRPANPRDTLRFGDWHFCEERVRVKTAALGWIGRRRRLIALVDLDRLAPIQHRIESAGRRRSCEGASLRVR